MQRNWVLGNFARYLCCGDLRMVDHFATDMSHDCRPQSLLKPRTMLKHLQQTNSPANSLDPFEVDRLVSHAEQPGVQTRCGPNRTQRPKISQSKSVTSPAVEKKAAPNAALLRHLEQSLVGSQEQDIAIDKRHILGAQSIGTAKILSRCGSFGRACFNVGNASNGLANSPSAWSRETTNALGKSPRISAWSSSVSEPSSWTTSCSSSWLVARRLLRQISAIETSRWQTRLWTSSIYAPEVTRSLSSSG